MGCGKKSGKQIPRGLKSARNDKKSSLELFHSCCIQRRGIATLGLHALPKNVPSVKTDSESVTTVYPGFRFPNSRKGGANRGPCSTLGYPDSALRARGLPGWRAKSPPEPSFA